MNSSHISANSSWETIKLVGKGGSSCVYKARFNDSGNLIAVKQIDTSGMTKEQILSIKNEIDTMKELNHRNIIEYYGTQQVLNKINIFLEFADRGSLMNHYRRKGPLKEIQAINCTRQILNGLEYLHSKGIAHRDIKCANCLLTHQNIVKLADFGSSKKYESESLVSGLKGTPNWMAPEVIKGTQLATEWFKADIWSLGCTIVEMLTANIPFSEYDNPMTAMFHIGSGKSPSFNGVIISDEFKAYLELCFNINPGKRPSVEFLLNHTFMKTLEVEKDSTHSRSMSNLIVVKSLSKKNNEIQEDLKGLSEVNNLKELDANVDDEDEYANEEFEQYEEDEVDIEVDDHSVDKFQVASDIDENSGEYENILSPSDSRAPTALMNSNNSFSHQYSQSITSNTYHNPLDQSPLTPRFQEDNHVNDINSENLSGIFNSNLYLDKSDENIRPTSPMSGEQFRIQAMNGYNEESLLVPLHTSKTNPLRPTKVLKPLKSSINKDVVKSKTVTIFGNDGIIGQRKETFTRDLNYSNTSQMNSNIAIGSDRKSPISRPYLSKINDRKLLLRRSKSAVPPKLKPVVISSINSSSMISRHIQSAPILRKDVSKSMVILPTIQHQVDFISSSINSNLGVSKSNLFKILEEKNRPKSMGKLSNTSYKSKLQQIK